MKYIWVDDAKSPRAIRDAVNSSAGGVDAVLGQTSSIWDFVSEIPLYTLPVTFRVFLQQPGPHCDPLPQSLRTRHVFNFMINKKMDHRYLTMRLIEYFGLTSYDYTYSGSCTNINDEQIYRDIRSLDPDAKTFTDEVMSEILGPVNIPIRKVAPEHTGYYEVWQHGLRDILQNSLVSLVTESDNGDYGPVSVFTEKTVYAWAAGTIPIWPGGYRNAEQMQRMGFDVFEDLVDHGYQYEDTMFMRCYRAFHDNLGLLDMDLAEANTLRQRLQRRFEKNHAHLTSSKLHQWYRAQLRRWPESLRNAMCERHAFLR